VVIITSCQLQILMLTTASHLFDVEFSIYSSSVSSCSGMFLKCAVVGYSSWHPCMTAKLELTLKLVSWHCYEGLLINAATVLDICDACWMWSCPLLMTSVVGGA